MKKLSNEDRKKIVAAVRHFHCNTRDDPGFSIGGGSSVGVGGAERRCPTEVLFSANICKNERISPGSANEYSIQLIELSHEWINQTVVHT